MLCLGERSVACGLVDRCRAQVWDDMSMINVDFSVVCPMFNVQEINRMEVKYLQFLNWNGGRPHSPCSALFCSALHCLPWGWVNGAGSARACFLHTARVFIAVTVLGDQYARYYFRLRDLYEGAASRRRGLDIGGEKGRRTDGMMNDK